MIDLMNVLKLEMEEVKTSNKNFVNCTNKRFDARKKILFVREFENLLIRKEVKYTIMSKYSRPECFKLSAADHAVENEMLSRIDKELRKRYETLPVLSDVL
ncbi:unnamed protein product [Schistosoma turkestanicum]|nr:unnamed protein product [Schistosoma turkestanicum]